MDGVFFRTPFNHDSALFSRELATVFDEPSLTVQSMAEDADINVIMRRYGITGRMPDNPRLPSYADFTGIVDFKSALQSVMDAQDAFLELPAEVRSRFNNSPQDLLQFVSDPGNKDQLVKIFGGKVSESGQSGSGGGGSSGGGVGAPPQAAAAAAGAAAGGNPPAAAGGGAGAPPQSGVGAPAR